MNLLRRATGREAHPTPAADIKAKVQLPPPTKNVLLRPAPGCTPTPPPSLTEKQQKDLERLCAYGQELHQQGWKPSPEPKSSDQSQPATATATTSATASTTAAHPDEGDSHALTDEAYKPLEDTWLADPGTCARFYRAAKYDLGSARKRLHATLHWRRTYQPEIIPPDEVYPEAETGKSIVSGFDREGRPILYLRPGRENTQTSDRQIRFLVWNLERLIGTLFDSSLLSPSSSQLERKYGLECGS